MANNQHDLDWSAAEVRRNAAEMVISLAKQRDILRDLQRHLPAKQFKDWAVNSLGMDDAILQDFLAFDGTRDSRTQAMLRHVMTTLAHSRTF